MDLLIDIEMSLDIPIETTTDLLEDKDWLSLNPLPGCAYHGAFGSHFSLNFDEGERD